MNHPRHRRGRLHRLELRPLLGRARTPTTASSPSTSSPTRATARTSTASTSVHVRRRATSATSTRRRAAARGPRRSTSSSTSPPSRTTAWRSSIRAASSARTSSGTQTLLEAARRVGVAPLPPRLDLRGVRRPRPRHRRARSPRSRRTGRARRTTRRRRRPTTRCARTTRPSALPITITNCANNYGPYQFPEKVIPLFTTLRSTTSRCRSTRRRRTGASGSTPSTTAAAIDLILERRPGRRDLPRRHRRREAASSEIADAVLDALGKPASLKTIVPDRPGHDRRYLLDSSKIRTRARLGADDRRWDDRASPRRSSGTPPTATWWEPLRDRAPVAESSAWTRRRRRMTMRVLVTGAGGQLGQDLVAAFPRRATTSSPPTTPQLDVTDRDAVLGADHAIRARRRRPLRGVDRRRRLRERSRTSVRRQRPGRALRRRGRDRAGAHLCTLAPTTCSTAPLDRPYDEWDAPNPLSVYGRSKLAGEVEARRRRRGDRAHVVGLRRARPEHGEDDAAPGRRARRAGVRRRPARLPDVRGRSGADAPPPRPRPARGHPPRDEPGCGVVVRVRPRSCSAIGQGPGDRVRPIKTADLDPPRAGCPARQRGARQRGAAGSRASVCSATIREPLAELSPCCQLDRPSARGRLQTEHRGGRLRHRRA